MTAFRPGPRNLITDVAGLKVGNAEDHDLKSGVTVVTADDPFVAGVHIMGGAPGTRETDVLAADRDAPPVNALVLSGGSAFGLDAASGVMDALATAGRGHAVGPAVIPIVPAAILFDLLNGGEKGWAQNPYRGLGARALDAAGDTFTLGTAGAGTGAVTATLKGGLGSASVVLPGGATVGALVAVNAIGSVATSSGHFWAAAAETDGEFGARGPAPQVAPEDHYRTKLSPAMRQNTTIAVVATDAALTGPQASRMATVAHDGIARAISPAHTTFDGDLVFAAATAARPGPVDRMEAAMLSHAASVCLARAICRAVHAATPAPGDVQPTWATAFG